VRQFTGWSDSQLKTHLHRLEELEYLALHRGLSGQSFVYALNFEMDSNGRPYCGLSYGAKAIRMEANGSHGQVFVRGCTDRSGSAEGCLGKTASGLGRVWPSLGGVWGGLGKESPAMTRAEGAFSGIAENA